MISVTVLDEKVNSLVAGALTADDLGTPRAEFAIWHY